ncbi:MAG TPA: class F sortase [Anaerolineales bacterium]|nr:class F sortase [Anaerolineales bacterium]
MSNLTHRIPLHCLAAVLVLAAVLAGCGYETGQTQPGPAPSPMIVPSVPPTAQATPTLFVFGPLIESNLDLRAEPEAVPLELQIPSLEVNAPMLAVGLTSDNLMDSPRGPISDPIWNTAYWYRGGGVPGDVGTATIAGHVNDPLGKPVIFADLDDLKPGDSIIIHLKNTNRSISFIVDEVKLYTVQESSDPAVLTKIYGAGPVAGTAPQPSPDGLSHLTLITCAGEIINGAFDQHTVVYATRSD